MLAETLSEEADVTIVDMEAGLEHLSRSGGTLKHVDVLLVIVEAYAKAIETGRRTVALARELGIPMIGVAASKVRDHAEQALVEALCAEEDVPLLAVIPYDDAVRIADRDGASPVDAAPDSASVRAIAGLADRLEVEASPPAG